MVGPPFGLIAGDADEAAARNPSRSTGVGGGRRGRNPEDAMFEPLDRSENEKASGSHRSMRVIWIVIAAVTVVLAVLSFR